MNIGGTTQADLFPTFLNSSVELLDILVKGALAFETLEERKMCWCAHASPLAWTSRNITRNISFQRTFTVQQTGRTSATGGEKQKRFLIFRFMFHGDTAVWIDTGLCVAVGRLTTLQSQSGNITFRQNKMCRYLYLYTHSGWCNDVTVIQQHCSPDLESFFINCKPFYSPPQSSRTRLCLPIHPVALH